MPGLPRERRIHATSIHAALVAAATTDCHSRTGMLVSRWITNAADENGPAKLIGLAQHIYGLLQGEDRRLAQCTVAAVRFTALYWGGGEGALQTHYERPEAERTEIRNTIKRIMHAEYESENGAKPPAWYFALEPVPPPALPFAAPFGNGPDQRFPWLPSTYANCFQRCGEFFVDPANPERLGFRRDQGFPLEWFQADNSLVYFLINPDGTFTKIAKTNESIQTNVGEYLCLLPKEPAPGELRNLRSRNGPSWLMQLEMLWATRAQAPKTTCDYFVFILPRVCVPGMQAAHTRLEAGKLEQPLVGSYVLGRGNLGLFPWGNAKERGMSWADIEAETIERFQLLH